MPVLERNQRALAIVTAKGDEGKALIPQARNFLQEVIARILA